MPQPHELADSLAAPRAVRRILTESFTQYFKHLGLFTRPLVLPIFYKLIGGMLAVLGPFLFVDFFMGSLEIQDYRHLGLWYFQQPFSVRFLLMSLVVLPGIVLFSRGFWLYLVYMASMSINAVEVLAGQVPDFKTAFARIRPMHYTCVLLWLVAIWVPALVLYLLAFILPWAIPVPAGAFLVLGLCLLGTLGALLAAAVFSVYLSVSFQVVALESYERALHVLRRSVALVFRNFGRTLLLLAVVGGITTLLIPFLVNGALDLSQLSDWLALPGQYLVEQLLVYLAPDKLGTPLNTGGGYAMIYPLLVSESATLGLEVLHGIIGTVVTLLLLPLGTFVSTLLYLDLRARLTA